MVVDKYPRRPVRRPATIIETDTSALTGSASESEKKVVLLGPAEGGKPNTPYLVRSVIQAREIFRGGELLDALEMAWNPSNNSRGAGTIIAMRVEDAKPAKLEVDDVTFKSKLYGTEANGITVELKEKELLGKKSKVLKFKFEKDEYARTYRDIGRIIDIEKEEGGDAPKYLAVEVTDTHLIIYSGASEEEAEKQKEEFKLGEGAYRKANMLVNGINSIKGVQATMPTGGNKNINTRGLDQKAKTEITNTTETVTALVADIYKQLEYDEYVEVIIADAKIDPDLSDGGRDVVIGGAKIGDFDETALSGGAKGTVPSSWASKFEHVANQGGYYLVPLTDSQAIHAEATAFANERSANGEIMRVIAGAGYDETPSQLLGRASSLRNSRATLVGISGKRNLGDGRVVETPAYMFAAQVAGIASGLPVGEAVTFKNVTLTELATIYDSEQMDDLNSGGVIMAEFVRNGNLTNFRIVDDVTTFNDPTDPVKNQMGVGEGSDYLISELKTRLDENYIGTNIVNMSASLLKSGIQSFLDEKKRNDEIQDYNPEDIQVVIDGEVANITIAVYPLRNLKRIRVGLIYRQQIISA